MSLNLNDLDLISTVRDIIGDLNSGEVVILDILPKSSKESYNPYDTDSEIAQPEVIGVYPFISFKDGTTKYNEKTGVREGGYFKVKTGMPEQGGMYIKAKHYCYVNFSEGNKVIVGVVHEVRTSISSLMDITCKATDTVPYTWEQVLAMVVIPSPLSTLVLPFRLPPLVVEEKLMQMATVSIPKLGIQAEEISYV
jgi:hypothetical protein